MVICDKYSYEEKEYDKLWKSMKSEHTSIIIGVTLKKKLYSFLDRLGWALKQSYTTVPLR